MIRRDDGGRPTGVLHERASSLVTERVPRPTVAVDRRRRSVPLATDLLALGVVAVHDPGSHGAARADLGGPLEAYRTLAAGR